MHLKHEVINTVGCPTCGAEIGEPCRQGAKGKREHKPRSKNHQARPDAATKIDRARKAKRRKPYQQHSKPFPEVIDFDDQDWLTANFIATIQG